MKKKSNVKQAMKEILNVLNKHGFEDPISQVGILEHTKSTCILATNVPGILAIVKSGGKI